VLVVSLAECCPRKDNAVTSILIGPAPAGPRPPRPVVFYPSQLSLFLECPQRYYLKYGLRRPVEAGFSPSLAKGIAVHATLAEVAEGLRLGRPVPGEAVLRSIATSHLPHGPYPSEISWHSDVAIVLAQAQYALAGLAPDARVVAVEQTYSYAYPGGSGCPPFTLRCRADLVTAQDGLNTTTLTEDAALTVTDWKSGGRPNRLQTVIALIVAHHAYPHAAAIHSATVFLATRRAQVEHLGRDDVAATWRLIKRTVAAILVEREWRPNPSALCEWCPYETNGCALAPVARPDEADDEDAPPDATTRWLEG